MESPQQTSVKKLQTGYLTVMRVSLLLSFLILLIGGGVVLLLPDDGTAETAGVETVVQVPDTMKSAPFNVERKVQVKSGTTVSVVARVPNARFMTFLPDGSLLVTNPGSGVITRVVDGVNQTWLSGLKNPHDMVVKTIGGTTWLYLAESNKISRYPLNGATPGTPEALVTGLPDASTPELQGAYGHQLKNIALNDTHLYVSIASTCNACVEDTVSDPVRGAVYQYSLDGKNGRLYARGLRNAEGLSFAPNGQLWVAVNNRDNINYPFDRDITGDGQSDYGKVIPDYVDNHPPEEITAVRDGGDYGWPYCNPDPDTAAGLYNMPFTRDTALNPDGAKADCATRDKISVGIQAHSAPLGFSFLGGSSVPAPWNNGAVVGLHGSWNRQDPIGYNVTWGRWDGTTLQDIQPILSGFISGSDIWGRPVDAIAAPDGSLYVSDDKSGTVYRVVLPAGTTDGGNTGGGAGSGGNTGGETGGNTGGTTPVRKSASVPTKKNRTMKLHSKHVHMVVSCSSKSGCARAPWRLATVKGTTLTKFTVPQLNNGRKKTLNVTVPARQRAAIRSRGSMKFTIVRSKKSPVTITIRRK